MELKLAKIKPSALGGEQRAATCIHSSLWNHGNPDSMHDKTGTNRQESQNREHKTLPVTQLVCDKRHYQSGGETEMPNDFMSGEKPQQHP